jgi:hypothetical protein
MTCAEAELVIRGRGPPPVPRRISLVPAPWAATCRSLDVLAAAMALVRNVRRLITAVLHA